MSRPTAISCRAFIVALAVLFALPATARTRPHYGGTLRVEVEGDPWQRPGGLARTLVLDGLTSIGPDGAALPALAVEWKAENDNHRWQFRLRAGVHFHDGTPLNSANVVASLTAACGARCPWTAVHAVGPLVIFTSDAPLPTLPELLADDAYRIAMENSDGAPSAPVGTGAFQFASLSNDVLTLTANESCWQGRPFVDSIELRARRSVRDQWLNLTVGRADLVEVPAEQIRQAQAQRLNVLASAPVSLLALTVSDSAALANQNLRAAIALAVDRSALSNVIFQKQGEITASLLPAQLTGYAFLFPAERDLNRAHELRGGAGAVAITLAADPSSIMQLAAQRIALNLRDSGFTVQNIPSGVPQHADLTLLTFTLNSTQSQPALDALLHQAGLAASVLDSSPAGLYKIEREILDTHMIIPLLYLPRAFAVGGRVRDLRLSAGGTPLLANASLEDAP